MSSQQQTNTNLRNEQVAGESTSPFFTSLEWRSIGPYRGGRVVAVAGDPVHEQVFYFGSTGGGVWKTTDGGVFWQNISDGFFQRASVGAIAVAPSDPNVIYVGMGETTIRGNVAHGDGVYKSTDGGKTWLHMGLTDTRQIGKIRVHPQNPNLVYVAALGHAHGPNKERGVYRSSDGGMTWEHILDRGEEVGVHDLAMDPNNPRILFAAAWRARRLPYALESGGEGCGIFKSIDGGETWSDITHNQGLPQGVVGKIGVTVSGAKPDRVWALIEAEDGALFRSDDGGEKWERLSEEKDLRTRPWYYMHVYADPQDADTVWVLNEKCLKSIDGGSTFFKVPTPHGDNHDLWIDPQHPQRMIEGNDGGACVTFNGSQTWSSLYNQPTAEFYHVITDTQVPYRVYGAQQDNTTITLPSRSRHSAIVQADYYEVGGGESGYIAIRPDNPNIVFAGSYLGYLTRYDHSTGEVRDITVWPEATLGWPAKDAKYRFQWTFPILLSPHDPNILYATGNHVFRSTDEGNSWEEISPDLSRNDVSKMESSGGPLTKDNVGTEYYGTIFAFAESPLERGLFWAGSDDGLVHISRDNGKSWQNVTPPDLPEWALISIIEPSPHDPATAYLAATRYKLDDFHPYLYKTHDYGQTWTKITNGLAENIFTRAIREDPARKGLPWTKITNGLAENIFTRAIREDPARKGLLFAGTETGVSVSFDDGEHWQSLKLNLPVVPIHDLVIKDSDLIVATHGRSFWILDDITPLRQLNDEVRGSSTYLFPPRPLTRFVTIGGYGHSAVAGKNYRHAGAFTVTYVQEEQPTGEKINKYLDAGQNPPDGVIVHYYLKEQPQGKVTLAFLDAEGKEIRSFASEEKPQAPAQEAGEATESSDKEKAKKAEKKEPHVVKEAGSNRFVWDTRYPKPVKIEGVDDSDEIMKGPLAPPGTYQVRLTVGDQVYSQHFQIRKSPHIPTSQAQLQEQFALLLAIKDKISELHTALNTMRAIRRQIDEWQQRARGSQKFESIEKLGKKIKEQLSPIEDELFQSKAKDQLDTMDYPMKLSAQLASLADVVSSAAAPPTRQGEQVFNELSGRLAVQLAKLQEVIGTSIAEFNVVIREADLPAIVTTAPEQKGA